MTTDARFLENPFPDRVRNLAILRRGAISNEIQKKRPCVAQRRASLRRPQSHPRLALTASGDHGLWHSCPPTLQVPLPHVVRADALLAAARSRGPLGMRSRPLPYQTPLASALPGP